jgi:flagellar biosynthesis GTPase FlhF
VSNLFCEVSLILARGSLLCSNQFYRDLLLFLAASYRFIAQAATNTSLTMSFKKFVQTEAAGEAPEFTGTAGDDPMLMNTAGEVPELTGMSREELIAEVQRERAAKEAERAAKEAERAAKEEERAAKEEERAAKEEERAAKEAERALKEEALAQIKKSQVLNGTKTWSRTGRTLSTSIHRFLRHTR